MIETSGWHSVVEMRQSPQFGFERQPVDDGVFPASSRLTSPGPFHIHRKACAATLRARRCRVSCGEAWVEPDIQEKLV